MSRKLLLFVAVFIVFVFLFGKEAHTQSPEPPLPKPFPLPDRRIDTPPPPIPPSVSPNVPSPTPPPSKNIWSLQMEQVDGRNVIRATLGKKREIKITCDDLDFQSQKNVLVAKGNVGISAEDIECRCECLTIHLNEDKLLLEGKAKVNVRPKIIEHGERKKLEPGEQKVQVENVVLELTGEELSFRLLSGDLPKGFSNAERLRITVVPQQLEPRQFTPQN